MAIDAKFTADFSDWNKEVQAASRTVKKLETDTETTMKAATKSTNEWAAAIKGAAAVFGVAFSAQQLVGFVGSVFEAADAIDTVAKSLGVSAEAAQRLKGAAEQSGSSLDTVQSAAFNLNKALGQGSPGTLQAIKALGLEVDTLRRMNGEEAFLTVTDALKGTTDALTFTTAGTELLGNTVKDLTPAIKAGFREVGETVTVMSNDAVARLNEAKAAWKAFSDATVTYTGLALAAIIKFAQDTAWASIGGGDKPNPFRKMVGDIELIPAALGPTTAALAAAAAEAKKFGEAEANIAALMAGPEGISGATREAIAYFLELGASQSDLATYFGVTAGAVKAVALEVERTKKAAEETEKAVKKAFGDAWADVMGQSLDWMTKQATALQIVTDKFDVLTQKAIQAKATLAEMKYGPVGGAAAAPGSPEAIQAAYTPGGGTPEEEEIKYLQFVDAFNKAATAAGTMGDAVKTAGDKTREAGAQAQQASGHLSQLAQSANIVAGSFQNMWNVMSNSPTTESQLRAMNDMFSQYAAAGVPIHGGLMQPFTPQVRAAGGPVSSGTPYWVGEAGPELFTPKTSGTISPAGSGSIVVNVSGLMLSDDPAARAQLAAVIQNALMSSYRQHGHRQPI